jgi:serine phosphatase RsbU (regulator of sigma subunit)
MLNRLKNILYILVPLIIVLIVIIDLLSFYSGITIELIAYLREFAILGLIFLCYQLIKSKLPLDELTIQENLLRLVLLISANFAISLLVKFILQPAYTSGFPANYESAQAIIVSTMMAFTASFTLVPALFILKKLIFYKRKRNTAIVFNLYLVAITLNAFSVYFSRQPVGWLQFSEQTLYNDITFSFALLFVIILSFRNEWITYRSRKQKIIYFFLGIPTYLAIAALFDIVYRQSLPAYSLTIAALTFNMLIFLLVYGGLAIFKLLLQLPTARAFDRKMKELNSLYDLGRMLNSETKLDKLLPLVTQQSSQILESQCTWLANFDEQSNKFKIASSINLSEEEVKNIPLTEMEGLNHRIVQKKEAYLVNDVPHNRIHKNLLQWKKEISTIIGAPLFSNRNQLMGIIYATKPRAYTFDIDDVSLIQGIANQASVAIENAHLLLESIKRERLEQELKIARDVQLKLIPQKLPNIENFDIEAHCITAYEVGGDYYDFFYFADGNPGFIIGDVSGKGTSAALYMAEFKGIIQTLAANHKSPHSLTCDINRMFYPNIERKSFISAIIAKIEPKKGMVKFIRAGHTPLIYCDGNGPEPNIITSKGIGIGLDPGSKFDAILEEASVKMHTNGTIVLYTDGVIEARNDQGHEFGEERLMTLMMECKNGTAIDLKEKIIDSVGNFCDQTPLHDDLTFIVLKNNKNLPN